MNNGDCVAMYLPAGPRCQLAPAHPGLHFATEEYDGEPIYFSWDWMHKRLTMVDIRGTVDS